MHSFTLNHSFPSIPETLFQKGLFWRKRNDKNRSIKQEIEPCIYNLLNWFTFFCCILWRFTTHHQKSLSRVTIFIPFSAIYYLEYHFLMWAKNTHVLIYTYLYIQIIAYMFAYKFIPGDNANYVESMNIALFCLYFAHQRNRKHYSCTWVPFFICLVWMKEG